MKKIIAIIALALTLFEISAKADDEKPNFLFIISDDQAPDTIRALGNSEIVTPNLDRLVKRGTTFTHCFNQGSWSGAVCVASRTMLITGQTVYRAPRNKVYLDSWAYAKGDLAVDEDSAVTLWPEVFREAGYRTFLTGKWHNNQAAILQGFTDGKAVGSGFYNTFEFEGQKSKDNPGYHRPTPENNRWNPWDPKFHGHWNPEVVDITEEGEMGIPYITRKHTSEVYADAAVSFLQQNREEAEPFFMFVSFNAPHDPRQAPKEYIDQYSPEKIKLPDNFLPEHPFDNGAIKIRDEVLAPFPRTREIIKVHRAEYNAIMTHMDHEIGRILDALEASGRAGNTYIIFTSDHGLAMGSHGLLGKQNPYDHSIRMPFLISGPDVPKDRRVDDLIYMQSVYPTTCELAGLDVPESVEFPSVKNLAVGGSDSGGEEMIFGTYLTFQRLVRTDTHKLVYYPELDRYQLFDMVADPGEMTDLSEDPAYETVKAKLIARLDKERQELGDGLSN